MTFVCRLFNYRTLWAIGWTSKVNIRCLRSKKGGVTDRT